MTEHEIEEKVKSAFTSCVPNILDNILSECDYQEGRVITMTEAKSKIGIFKWATGIVAALVLVFASVLAIHLYQTNYKIASTVLLDVNPSIEIKTNKKEKVLDVNALNEDGRIVIGDMNLKGDSIDVVVNALIGSMLRNGYLSDVSNSILVSVCGENTESSSALQEKLTKEINLMFETDDFSGAVLSQTISPDADLQELADSYGISLGKARLLRQVVAQQPEYSFEDLSGRTINELNLMSELNGIVLDEVQVVGNASDKAYIGVDKAKEAAFSHAGVLSESGVSKLEIEMDYEHESMIYEVSFLYNDYKYNYDIDACSGAIMEASSNPLEDKGKDEKEKSDNENNNISTVNSNIGYDKAGKLASLKQEFLQRRMYLSMKLGTTSSAYDINANTGNITETNLSPVKDKSNLESNNNTVDITAERAKEIALSRAGLGAGDITDYNCETYVRNEITVYKIKFVSDEYQYSCDVDAKLGQIVKYNKQLKRSR